jgi:hypothetical protein
VLLHHFFVPRQALTPLGHRVTPHMCRRYPRRQDREAQHRCRLSCVAVPSATRTAWVTTACLALMVALLLTQAATALEPPGSGVTLGSWSDDTSRYFGSSTEFLLADNTRETVASPPLRVLALMDWQSQRRTELLSSWPNRTSLTLWANRDLATSLVSRARAAALVYRSIWSTESLPASGSGRSTAPYVVSAIGADLLGRGDADALLQASDGSLYVLNHSAASASTQSNAFERIVISGVPLATTSVALREPTAPSVSVVPGFFPSGTTHDAAQVEIAFVNAKDQLIVLSRATSTTWPPMYVPHILVDENSEQTGRVVLPLSIVAADVNEDCAAELLFAVRDSRRHRYEVHLFNTASFDDAAVAATTPLLELAEDGSESYGDTFTMADVNGDGLPELVVAVQLANQSSSCATADTAGVAEKCTPYHGVRVFYPSRAADVHGAPQCRPSSSSSDHHLSYNLGSSEVFVLTQKWCGVEDWLQTGSGGTAGSSARLPLYMPSYPSAPLLLRPGDYNRDRLVDLVVPSSYGPLLLTSRAASGVRPLVCTALDSATGKAAVQKALTHKLSSLYTATVLDAYRTATPFFATLALLGRLEVVLTHHRLFTAATSSNAMNQIRVYQNSEVPSRSYFLSATALTMLKSYGAGCIGATHHMTWQDIHMHSHWATDTQQGRTQGHALLPPHLLVGLDETFSYVHDYAVGLRIPSERSAVVQAKEWPSYLVPNSQVFAEVHPAQKPSKWILQLYLPTSTYRRLLVVALAFALLIIGLPVIWLRCGEMRHDYNEWRRMP